MINTILWYLQYTVIPHFSYAFYYIIKLLTNATYCSYAELTSSMLCTMDN